MRMRMFARMHRCTRIRASYAQPTRRGRYVDERSRYVVLRNALRNIAQSYNVELCIYANICICVYAHAGVTLATPGMPGVQAVPHRFFKAKYEAFAVCSLGRRRGSSASKVRGAAV